MSYIIILPVCRPDFHLAVKWLMWVRMLDQIHRLPATSAVAVLAAKSVRPSEIATLNTEVSGLGFVRQHAELFERPDLGYGAMANYAFLEALKFLEASTYDAMLWCEPDCVPARTDWFDRIVSDWESSDSAFKFMGDFHAPGAIPHPTGNGVYTRCWRQIAPSLANIVTDRPEQGWDSKCAHEILPYHHRSSTIQQTWLVPMPRFTAHNLKMIHPDAALFHRCKDGSLIDVLAEKFGLPPIPLDAPLCAPSPVMSHSNVPANTQPSGVGFLIVTFARDVEFLDYCLKSIRKYCRGFNGVTIAVPVHQAQSFRKFQREGVTITTFVEEEGKGFLRHLIMKTRADELCPRCEFVVHIDPDCIFWRDCTPGDFVRDGQCRMIREDYAKIERRNPNRLIWREMTERATGIRGTHDLMVSHPNVYPRKLYAHVRGVVERHTGVGFDEYVLSCENGFPQTYCEFVTLSAVGLRDMPEMFSVTDYDHEAQAIELAIPTRDHQYAYTTANSPLVEVWSHAGLSRYKSDMDQWLAGKTPKYYLK